MLKYRTLDRCYLLNYYIIVARIVIISMRILPRQGAAGRRPASGSCFSSRRLQVLRTEPRALAHMVHRHSVEPRLHLQRSIFIYVFHWKKLRAVIRYHIWLE